MTTRHPHRDAKIRIGVFVLLAMSASLLATSADHLPVAGGLFFAATFALLPAGSLAGSPAPRRPSVVRSCLFWTVIVVLLAIPTYYLVLKDRPLPAWAAVVLAVHALVSGFAHWREVDAASDAELQQAFEREKFPSLD